jgi:hypothetical protein
VQVQMRLESAIESQFLFGQAEIRRPQGSSPEAMRVRVSVVAPIIEHRSGS